MRHSAAISQIDYPFMRAPCNRRPDQLMLILFRGSPEGVG